MKTWLDLVLAVSIVCTASAQSPPCATDEYLNTTTNTCLCNLTMYTSAASPPEPTVQCLSGQMKLSVSRCQLEKSKFDSANLHLLDPTCTGVRVVEGVSPALMVVSTSSALCGNKVTFNGTHVFYSNNLTIPAKVAPPGLVSRINVTYAFSCSYPFHIPIHPIILLQRVTSSPPPGGDERENVFMVAYTDSSFTIPYNQTTMTANVPDPLYVSVSIPDLDASQFSVLVTHLYATRTSDPNATTSYDIITDGCPSAQMGDLLTIVANGHNTEARFKVEVFRITNTLYLHAEVQICTGNPCNQTCGSSSNSEIPTKSVLLSSGPFQAASAQSATCATDEYFDNTANTCLCNLTMYTSSASPPAPTVQCLSGQMKLKVSKCQLEKSKYDTAIVHLVDPNCKGVRVVEGLSPALMVVSTSTSSALCGNKLTFNSTHVFYSNNLTIPAKVAPSGLVARNNVTYAFSCSYPLNIPVSLATTLSLSIGVTDIPVPGGVGAVMVFMVAYTDSSFMVPYTETTMTINVQDPLYVSVSVPDLDATQFSVLVTRLYATGTSDNNAAQSYDIITDGCTSAQLGDLLTIMNNGINTEARFKVEVFQITGMNSLYLHAVVQICTSNPCNQTCSGSSGRISTNSVILSGGPFHGGNPGEYSEASSRFSWIWTVNSLLLSLLGLRLL